MGTGAAAGCSWPRGAKGWGSPWECGAPVAIWFWATGRGGEGLGAPGGLPLIWAGRGCFLALLGQRWEHRSCRYILGYL